MDGDEILSASLSRKTKDEERHVDLAIRWFTDGEGAPLAQQRIAAIKAALHRTFELASSVLHAGQAEPDGTGTGAARDGCDGSNLDEPVLSDRQKRKLFELAKYNNRSLQLIEALFTKVRHQRDIDRLFRWVRSRHIAD